MKWQIVNTGKAGAQQIMDLDHVLLKELTPDSNPILHFYEWQGPTITYGYFLKPADHLTVVATNEFELARRPTGGGFVFHVHDFSFSILIPASHPQFSTKTEQNYLWINQLILKALQAYVQTPLNLISNDMKEHIPNFCMAQPVKYDIMVNGKKVAGGAQRRTKNGFLHQGTIACLPVVLPYETLLTHSHNPVSYFTKNNGSLFLASTNLPRIKKDLLNALTKVFKTI